MASLASTMAGFDPPAEPASTGSTPAGLVIADLRRDEIENPLEDGGPGKGDQIDEQLKDGE